MKKLFHELKTYKGFYLFIVLVPILALLIAQGIYLYGVETQENRYESNLSYGYASLEAEEYSEAITAFENAYRMETSYEAAVGLAKAWFGSGDAEKAVQILAARAALYESTEEIETLMTEYKITLGIYPTVIIGGKEIETNSTAVILDDCTLTDADKALLAEFTDMVTFSAVNCGLTDIEFMRGWDKIMSVHLTKNPISDFTPLHNKPDLRTLYINDTAIKDFSQLHPLTMLSTLNANGNWITLEDSDALDAALPTCEVYTGNGGFLIFDITIGDVIFQSNAKELDLCGLNISDVTPLNELSAITKLDLSSNKITWITPMEDMRTLTDLDMSDNRVSNISALSKMTRMVTLNLENNKVTDLSPLGKMKKLTELNLNNNPIYHGQETLSKLTALQTLHLQSTQLQDKHLDLLPMDSLTMLDIRGNKQLSEGAVMDLIDSYPNCTIYNDFVEVEEDTDAE